MVNKREVFAAFIKEPEIRFCIGVIVAFALLMAAAALGYLKSDCAYLCAGFA